MEEGLPGALRFPLVDEVPTDGVPPAGPGIERFAASRTKKLPVVVVVVRLHHSAVLVKPKFDLECGRV